LEEIWTAIPVLLQFTGLYVLLYALGKAWGGVRAGWMACGLGGATMLLQFSFGLGQETGLTTIGVVGMVFYLVRFGEDRSLGALLAAGACAGLAACAREYGLAFLVVGGIWTLVGARSVRFTAAFALIAGALPIYWHARNWFVTGNPFYAQDIWGLFPVNPVFDSWMQGYVEIYGSALGNAAGWAGLARYLLIGALPPLLGLLIAMITGRRLLGWVGVVLLLAVILTVWILSIPFTAGGLFYSMRVLAPALAIGCAMGGAVVRFLTPYPLRVGATMVAVFVVGFDASLRALTMPQNPYSTPIGSWMNAGYSIRTGSAQSDSQFFDSLAALVKGAVLSDSAGVQRELAQRGIILKPFWSPDARGVFDPMSGHRASAYLLKERYSHLLLKRSDYSVEFLNRSQVLPLLWPNLREVAGSELYVLFEILDQPVVHE
jgi:hypothetical protein